MVTSFRRTRDGDVDTSNQGSAATKAELTAAAYRVIARRGASRLSVREIADEAGVSRGLVHYHFKNKDELVAHAIVWGLRSAVAAIRRTLRDPRYSSDPISALVDALFASPEAMHRFYLAYIDMIDRVGRGETNAEEFGRTARDLLESLFADVVVYATSAGFIRRTDVDAAARDVRIIVDGVFTQWLLEANWQATHSTYGGHCRRLLGTVLQEVPRQTNAASDQS